MAFQRGQRWTGSCRLRLADSVPGEARTFLGVTSSLSFRSPMTSAAPVTAPSVSVCPADHNLIDITWKSLADHFRILGDTLPCVKAIVDLVLELATCLEVVKR